MKTSKKMLSLFLALVMVITSCSVGFTAFAADGNNTDSNADYWNGKNTASDAYDALNGVVGELFGIDALKKLLQDNHIVEKVDENTTLSDVVAGASPLLINALGSNKSMDEYLSSDSEVAKIGQDSGFVTFSGKPEGFRQGYASKDLAAGGKNSFYSLYLFGSKYKDDSDKDVSAYAKSLLSKLDSYKKSADQNLAKALKADQLLVEFYNTAFGGTSADKQNRATTADFVSSIDLGNVDLSAITDKTIAVGTTLEDVAATKAAFDSTFGEGFDYYVTYYNNIFEKLGMPKLNNAAELVFYHTTNRGKYIIYANIYMYLLKQAGVPITAEKFASGDKTELTPENAYDYLHLDPADATDTGIYPLASFENDYIGTTTKTFRNGGDTTLNEGIYTQYLDFAIFLKYFAPNESQVDFESNDDDKGEKNVTGYADLLKGLNKVDKLVDDNSDEIKNIYKDDTTSDAEKTNAYADKLISAMGAAGSAYKHDNGGVAIASYFMDIVCNAKDYGYKAEAIPPETDAQAVAVANFLLEDTVFGLLDSIKSLVDVDQLISYYIAGVDASGASKGVTVNGLIDDLWVNLYKDPIATVVDLLPPLLIIIGGILPIVLHDDVDDSASVNELLSVEDAFLTDVLGAFVPALALQKYTQKAGDTSIGLGGLHVDLNKALPSILHWLTGDKEGAIKIVGTYKDTSVCDFNNNIPVFTNIYIADRVIYSITDKKIFEMVSGVLGDSVKNALGNNGLQEIITELLTFVRDSIDEYIATNGKNDKNVIIAVEKSDGDKKKACEVNDGLNDIKVALPKVIDILGKRFMKKYEVKNTDWAFAYSGKIATESITDDYGKTITRTYNAHIQHFEDFAKAKDSVMEFTSIVDLLIGNWVNALLDFLNDVLVDDTNKITSEVPLVQGLLAALGDFGETSIITDALNGLFQLKRCDDSSFTLAERTASNPNVKLVAGESDTKFVGFSLTSGFFLLCNIKFKAKDGTNHGLIPFIKDLGNPNPSSGSSSDSSSSSSSSSTAKTQYNTKPLLATSKKTDYNKLLSKENKEAAQKLVDVLDEILSSLLKNTSLNGFKLDATDNLLSGVVTLFSAYFGAQNTNDIIKLLNNYLYYVVGETQANPSKHGKIGTAPTKEGNVDVKKVYTSANLSNLVIQTYSFVENLLDYLFYNKDSGLLRAKDPHELVADAAYGLVSPDAVAVRMSSSYSKTAEILKKEDYHNWNSFKVEITALDFAKQEYNTKDFLQYGFSAGDKTAFYDALGESLNGIAGLIGALLATSYTDKDRTGNLYSEVLMPLLQNLADGVGATGVMSAADFNKATAPQQLIKGIITPIGNILSKLYDKPFSFILNLIKGLAGVAKDSTLSKMFAGLQGTVNLHIDGISNIVNYLSPSYGASLKKNFGKLKISIPDKNILVTILNNYVIIKNLGFALPDIDWDKLNKASTPGEVLLLVYGYVVDTLLGTELLTSLIDSFDPNISKILKNLSAAQVLDLLADIIKVVQSPTEVYWSFSEYASKLANTFSYPKGISAYKAENGIKQLDNIVNNIFPLLNGLGVTDIEGLDSLVNEKLYTNENITAIAKALYKALSGNSTVVQVLSYLDMDVTPKGVANFLMNKKYGKTYSSAAATLRKVKSWDDVKTLNWGYKNGSANAQQGFINGLAAALRPLNGVLSILLAEGKLNLIPNLNVTDLVKTLLNSLLTSNSTEILSDKGELAATLTYKLKGSEFILTVQSYSKTGSGARTKKSVLKINVDGLCADLEAILDRVDVTLGTNGYESAIIPLLEAFMCEDVKTYKQYKLDYKKAKDNLLIDILNPIGKLIDTVLANPFDTLTAILPNVAYYIDSCGLSQSVANLLAPITSEDGIIGALKKNGLDLDVLLESILGKDLGTALADLIGVKTKLTLQLTNLKTFNIQDIVVPLVQKLLSDKFGLSLPDFTFEAIASHGDIKTVKSAAKNEEGTYLTEQVQARQGEVLVAVLRYVADTLIVNALAINTLLGGIDAIKNNDTIKNVIDSVFNTISLAEKDDIVRAIFYILDGDATDKFFDYRGFKTKANNFSFGDLDEDFCRKLAPMLDGLIGGLLEGGLLGLVEEKLYTDELVGKAATGIYGAIEGVNISDSIGSLTDLLKLTDIDFTTANVAALLTDSSYGRTYASAAATIRNSSSWKNIKAESLSFGVHDRDSFLHALTAVLRPLFGVLDVLLNDSYLGLFNLVSIPGSDGYTSTIVPLLEALGVYNIKTQYQYREDSAKAYDNILLDILNPLWDKVEDILAAPLEVVMNLLPNLALVFANDGLLQIIDNLLTPITALLDALKPIVNVNEVLDAAGLDVPGLLKDKAGLSIDKFDLYDLQGTLKQLLGADKVVGTLNSVLKIIKIKDTALNLELPEIDWLLLASHGKYNYRATSQVACFGSRIAVIGDEDETLIAVLRYLIDTINYKDNYNSLMDLLGGLFEGNDTVAGVLDQVFGMLQGDSDTVITNLVDLLQTLAG